MRGVFKNGKFQGVKKICPVFKNMVFVGLFVFFLKWEPGVETESNVFMVYGGPRNPRTEAKPVRHESFQDSCNNRSKRSIYEQSLSLETKELNSSHRHEEMKGSLLHYTAIKLHIVSTLHMYL